MSDGVDEVLEESAGFRVDGSVWHRDGFLGSQSLTASTLKINGRGRTIKSFIVVDGRVAEFL